jgi:hypothetical protein
MSIDGTAETTTHPGPAKPKQKRRRKVARRRSSRPKPDEPRPAREPAEFAGITATTCCKRCTVERCLISTVALCKHPLMTSATGCGPLTLANRDKALKIIKHQQVGD